MRNKLLLIFLLVPLIVPIALTVYHANHSPEEWRLPIRGYDPRDILRGRYIQFRYDFSGVEDELRNTGILCLSGSRKNPTIAAGKSDRCDQQIRFNNGLLGAQRFYIPESIANEADRLVRGNFEDISVGVVITSQGMRPANLYYKGENLIETLQWQK